MDLRRYSERQQFHTGVIPTLLEEYLDSNSWNTMLEVGCGDGSLLATLKNLGLVDGKVVLASDISVDRIQVVQESLGMSGIVGDACKLSVKSNAMDIVVTEQVIEHVVDDQAMAHEMYRVLADGGVAYISTVFKKWYGWYFYRCNGKWTLDPTHVREYTDDSQLVTKLENAGFQILENRRTLDGRPIMDSILRRLKADRRVYQNSILNSLRAIRIPIPGYYIWELVCLKN